MEKIGILIETNNGEIKTTNFGVITAAQGNGNELYAFVLDIAGDDCRERLQDYGIKTVVTITSPQGPIQWHPVLWARAIKDAMEHFGINTLFGLTSAKGKDLLPRIAADLDAPLVMDCIHVNPAEHTVEKPQFSGKAIATIKVKGSHYLFGIRPNAIEAEPAPCEAETIVFQTEVTSNRLAVETLRQGPSRGVELSEAAIVISGGRAMANTENFDILKQCAETMGAAVGASRAAVDAGWVPHTMQVGQTGTTVSPKVYIACGISGSIQHFAGMKTSGFIIAVNTDPDAPIITNCDYYVITDLFNILPLLTDRLKAALEQS
ncbi:MAG: electron transfer flavoprotein subunit alpha/FixB family protein [Deltaproteobacteria bacterium]|nr:electron transfer flavoprotein subunit alpha/FixB family protein [Deltaproteobacteria bacterium]